jgi:hypothetical protein
LFLTRQFGWPEWMLQVKGSRGIATAPFVIFGERTSLGISLRSRKGKQYV